LEQAMMANLEVDNDDFGSHRNFLEPYFRAVHIYLVCPSCDSNMDVNMMFKFL